MEFYLQQQLAILRKLVPAQQGETSAVETVNEALVGKKKGGKGTGGLVGAAGTIKEMFVQAGMSAEPITNFLGGFLEIFGPVGEGFAALGQVFGAGLAGEIAQFAQGIMTAVPLLAELSEGMGRFWNALDTAGWHLSDFALGALTAGLSLLGKLAEYAGTLNVRQPAPIETGEGIINDPSLGAGGTPIPY